jgi:hypothetical protein
MINVCFVGSRWRGGDSFNYVFVSILIGKGRGANCLLTPKLGGFGWGGKGRCVLYNFIIFLILSSLSFSIPNLSFLLVWYNILFVFNFNLLCFSILIYFSSFLDIFCHYNLL